MTYIRFTDGSSVELDADALTGVDVEPGVVMWVDVSSPWPHHANGRRRVVVDYVADRAPIPEPDYGPEYTEFDDGNVECQACGRPPDGTPPHWPSCPWALLRRLVDVDPWESDGLRDYNWCHHCRHVVIGIVVSEQDPGDHTPDCPWLAARRALGMEA